MSKYSYIICSNPKLKSKMYHFQFPDGETIRTLWDSFEIRPSKINYI